MPSVGQAAQGRHERRAWVGQYKVVAGSSHRGQSVRVALVIVLIALARVALDLLLLLF